MIRFNIYLLCLLIVAGSVSISGAGELQSDVNGVVQNVDGNGAVILIDMPEIKSASDTPFSRIADKIAQKTLFVEGMNSNVNGRECYIAKVSGNAVTVVFSSPRLYRQGDRVKLIIPKKKIAVVYFTLIKGDVKEAGSVFTENLKTALIESGNFSVLERALLQPIVDELALSKSGLADDISEKSRQKLLTADIILSGTLAEMGNGYEVNIRLLNVKTGQAIAAINLTTPLFKPAEYRDSGQWNADFEERNEDYSWLTGKIGRYGFASVDTASGAGGSNKSMRLDYDFKQIKEKNCAGVKNKKKRDVFAFKGIEFFVKASNNIDAYINIDISDRDDPDMRDRWFVKFNAGKEWGMVRVPFEQFAYFRSELLAKEGFRPGRQVFDLSRVESIIFGTCNYYMADGEFKKGSLWIDGIRFYK